MTRICTILLRTALIVAPVLVGGCTSPGRHIDAGAIYALPDSAERRERGYVYYLDGAGGGTEAHNWAAGVRQGMLDAGYAGSGEMYQWETGMGIVADQIASEEFKRERAHELAAEIAAFRQAHPDAVVSLIGLSAGTAVAVFTLEALAEECMVDTVVLLSSSLSADYDLSDALRRVKNKLFVFSSQRDAVLMDLVPLVGTADRATDTTESMGAGGPKLPAHADGTTSSLYAERLAEIPWNEEFIAYGHEGRHIDSVNSTFVQSFVAPLVGPYDEPPRRELIDDVEGRVPNPGHDRWSRFVPGAWSSYEAEQVSGGQSTTFSLMAVLTFKSEDAILVQRTFSRDSSSGATADGLPLVPRQVLYTAMIDPAANPLTDERSNIKAHQEETVVVNGRPLVCRVVSVRYPGDSPAWGSNLAGTMLTHPEVPGGIVRLTLRTHLDGRLRKFVARLVDFDDMP